jgi:hypothetical protein
VTISSELKLISYAHLLLSMPAIYFRHARQFWPAKMTVFF